MVTPTLGVRYSYFERDDFRESGVAALAFDELEQQTLHSRVGVQLSTRIDAGPVVIVPEVSAGWEHEFLQDDADVVTRFAAGSDRFSADTSSVEEDTFYAGAGLSLLIGDRASAFLRYEGNFGDETDVHGVAAGVTVGF